MCMSERLSKTKINDYLQCPRKYKYRHVDNISSSQNKNFKIGIDVHKIAEKCIKEWQSDDSIDFLETLLNFESEYSGNYQEHCLHLSEFFKEKLVNNNYVVFCVEEKLDSKKYNFSGYSDIVLEKDDELTVIDYKTGKSSSVENYVTELCYYKMLIEDQYPDKNVKYAAIFFTKEGKYNELTFTDDESGIVNCSKAEYESKIDLMYEVRDKIEKKQFNPNRQFFCKNCEFKKYCDNEGLLTL